MASITKNLIEQIKLNTETDAANIASTAYGVCETAADTAAKTVEMTGFKLVNGVTIHVKFNNTNSVKNPTLNVNGTGAHKLVQYGTTAMSTTAATTGWQAGAIMSLTYDSTGDGYWVRDQGYNTNTTYSDFKASGENHAHGLVPDPGATVGSDKFLCENATWRILTTDDIPSLSPSITITAGANADSAPTVNVTVNGVSGTAQAIPQATTSAYGVTKLSGNSDDATLAATAKSVYDLSATVSGLLATANALVFQGALTGGTTTTAYTPQANCGDVYIVDGGKLINGEPVEVGDLLICTTDNTSRATSSNVNTIKSKWIIIQSNIDSGLFKGSNNLVDGNILIADGTDGKVKNSGVAVSSASIGFSIFGGTTSKTLTVEDSYTLGPACEKDITDVTNNTATEIENNDSNLITARAVYYGLPTINNIHNYDSDTNIYAPTTEGTKYQILVSNEVGAPVWTEMAFLQSESSTTANTAKYTVLTLGNSAKVSTASKHSEGKITIYSSGSGAHTIQGDATNTDYTHTLLNYSGTIVQVGSSGTAGSSTQPVYVDTNGVAKGMSFTAHAIYYGGSETSLSAASGLYTNDGGQLGINISSWPTSNTDRLYVNGSATVTGAFDIDGATTLGSTLEVTGATTLDSTLSVTSTSTLTGKVGIGCDPDNATSGDIHILSIQGSTIIKGANNSVAHLDITTASNVDSLNFIPDTTDTGSIGTTNKLWKDGYFSHSLNVSSSTSSVVLSSAGTITVTADAPSIILDTSASGKKDWTLKNSNAGEFTLSNDTHTLTGTDRGFKIGTYLYINYTSTIPSSTSNRYNLYVKGTTYHTDNVTFAAISTATDSPKLIWSGDNNSAAIYYRIPSSGNGQLIIETKKGGSNTDCLLGFNDGTNTTIYLNSDSSSSNTNVSFYPNTTNTGTLGTSSNRWKKAYIGTANTYGDEYTPVYWDDGVPTGITVIKKYSFSIASGETSATITQSHTNKGRTVITEIVVDQNLSYLNAPITWAIDNSGNIVLTTAVATSGAVSGYILTATGEPNT